MKILTRTGVGKHTERGFGIISDYQIDTPKVNVSHIGIRKENEVIIHRPLPLNVVDRIVGSQETKPEIEALNLTSKKRLYVRGLILNESGYKPPYWHSINRKRCVMPGSILEIVNQ